MHRVATDTFRESLSLLGVASRTAFLEPGIYSVRSLRFFWTVPQEPTAMMYLPEVYEFFAKSVPTLPDAAAARRVLILRDPAHDPRLTGDEVELIRRVAYDFEPITFDFMTAKEQTSVMRSASHVIGAHGAGLANLLYAAPGCRILEITMNLAGESVLRPWFYQIAARRGLPYLHLNKGTGDLTPSRVAEAMLALRRAR